MLTRITIFISLVSLFYYYCQSDVDNRPTDSKESMDTERSSTNSAIYNYEEQPDQISNTDSSLNYVSAANTYRTGSNSLVMSVNQY